MKATSEEVFSPKTLTITFETQEEVNEFYTLFNITGVCKALRYLEAREIRRAINPWAYTNSTAILLDEINRHS